MYKGNTTNLKAARNKMGDVSGTVELSSLTVLFAIKLGEGLL